MGKRALGHAPKLTLPLTFVLFSAQRQAAEYVFSKFPGLQDEISVDDYLKEMNDMQYELFQKVEPMTGAVALVQHLVRPLPCASFVLLTARSMQLGFPSPLPLARACEISSSNPWARTRLI